MKKLFVWLLITTVAVSLAFMGVGCKTAAETTTAAPAKEELAGQKITVIFPKHEMDTVGIFESQTREFEKLTGIKVELIQAEWDKISDKIIAEMSAGGSSYDVIEFDNTWVAKFDKAGWLVPLDDYMPSGWKEGLTPGAASTFSVGGKLYGVPWNNDIRFFMYNKKMLDDAGISAPPKTYDELIEQSKILMDKGIAKYGFAGFWTKGWSLLNSVTPIIYSFGGALFDEDGKPVFNTDPAVVEALQFMVDALNVEKIVDPASITYSQEDAMNIFAAGNVAFMPQGWPGVIGTCNNKELSNVVGQIGVAEWTLAKSPELQATMNLPEALAIPKTSKNKEAAWKYIEFITSKEKDKERGLTIGSIPLWTELYTDKDLLIKYPYWAQFGKQLVYAKGHPKLEWIEEWVNDLENETQAALNKEKTPQEALDDLLKDIKGNL
ncbi:MAG: ABC transporter substrate-binding protein [Candidatus Humimicrobiaceae bacterium]